MTFEEAHQKLLNELDQEYKNLRAIHEQKNFVNPDNRTYREAIDDFFNVSGKLFRLKGVWIQLVDEGKHDSQ